MVLNHNGPCYRCIFPRPPPQHTIVACGEGGILGPVVGTMGVLQALEAIKVLTGGTSSMLLFSAYSERPFQSIKMRPRRKDCVACSGEITAETMLSMDYEQFCGIPLAREVLQPEERISALEYSQIRQSGVPHVLLDVREAPQYGIINLSRSLNIPFSKKNMSLPESSDPIYVICQRGNDSQEVVRRMKDAGLNHGKIIQDVAGGFVAWKKEVDPDWFVI
jgi:adenylyltransferase/sulfurtransferase